MIRPLDSRRLVALAGGACLVLSLTGVSAGRNEPRGPQITSVHVGFAGQYKLGYWTPVEVTVRAGDEPLVAELALTVPDGDGVLSRVHDESGSMQLAVGEEQSRTVFVKFGQSRDELRVELRGTAGLHESPELLAERSLSQGTDQLPAPLAPGRELLVMVGSADARSDSRSLALAKEWQAAVARLGGVAPLPTRWYGYEGVDLVVLSTSEPAIYGEKFEQQFEALARWVRLGGRLLLSVGASAAEVLAPEAPLARFAPGKFAEMIPLRQTGVWETFAGTSERLDRVVGGGAFRLEVPKLVDVRGQIEAYEGNHPRDLPLVVRSPLGLGEVIFVGLDLDRPPFANWRGRGSFIDRLLARPETADEVSDQRVLGHVTELGYNDLIGQLHMALAQFAGVQLVPFAAVAALVAVYILAIGPLDYFFLKKLVGRMQWTWVTFPTLVVAFSGGIYALAHLLKGNQLRVNQVDLVDLDAESGLVRGTSWSTLYSPRIDTFDLALRANPSEIELSQPPRVLLSWMAVPGSGLSGLGRAAGSAMFTQPYDFSPRLDAIENLPIAMWSTQSLQARWWAEASSPVTAHLTDRGDHMLGGTLRLPADWPLTDAVMIYDRWAYPLAAELAGETIDVDKQLEPQTVETYFRHVTIFDEKSARASYDRASTDLVHILEIMMFHSLTGGELYTNLANRAQGYVDLSSQVRLGRAVIMGRATRPAAMLLRGGDAERELVDADGQHLTFYRFVLPVTGD
ncbi:MAG TPA: hypothetical protein VHY91_01205 [Pirellulales bacterium]|jgi:hypothetical protein|nr:hypothetical protein [Pirellulales bacterium]